MTKKPQLDEATRKVLERMLKAPPKPHEEMKVGKRKPAEASSRPVKAKLSKSPQVQKGKQQD
jgi:hypothetical protein